MSLLLENENLIQFIKYALAGGLATLCHILLFNLLAWKMFPALQANDPVVKLLHINIAPINDFHRARNSMVSNFLAFMVSNLVAYITNILWVFEGGRHNVFIEILLFYAVSGISMVIGTSFMGLLIKRFGVMTTYAFGTNIIAAVMINYAVRKFFIFQG